MIYDINIRPYNSDYLIICFSKDILNDMIFKGIIEYSKNLYEDTLTFLENTLLISTKFNLNNEFKININELKEIYRIINGYYNNVEINIYKNNIEILFNNKSLNYYILESELEISIEDTLNLKNIENLKKDFIKLQNNIENLVGGYKCYLK